MKYSARLWRLLCAAMAGSALSQPARADQAPVAVHDDVLVIDGHANLLEPGAAAIWQAPSGGSRVSLAQLLRGGVDVQVLAVQPETGPDNAKGIAAGQKEADRQFAAIESFIAQSGGKLQLARSVQDVHQIHDAGKIAVIVELLNAYPLGTDILGLARYRMRGVSVVGLAFIGHNAFADSSRPAPGEPVERHHGLSDLGRHAVERLNDLGLLIDVSQLSDKALHQTLKLTRAPVIASHSNVRTLIDRTRNLDDAALDAIKANGGVVMVTPFSNYLHDPTPTEMAKLHEIRARYGLKAEYKKAYYEGSETLPADRATAFSAEIIPAYPKASLKEYVDHIDYIAKRIGVNHVGIGTDFDDAAGITDYEGAGDSANVTAELVRRGYPKQDVAAIWGGNFLRVLAAAQAAARP